MVLFVSEVMTHLHGCVSSHLMDIVRQEGLCTAGKVSYNVPLSSVQHLGSQTYIAPVIAVIIKVVSNPAVDCRDS